MTKQSDYEERKQRRSTTYEYESILGERVTEQSVECDSLLTKEIKIIEHKESVGDTIPLMPVEADMSHEGVNTRNKLEADLGSQFNDIREDHETQIQDLLKNELIGCTDV